MRSEIGHIHVLWRVVRRAHRFYMSCGVCASSRHVLGVHRAPPDCGRFAPLVRGYAKVYLSRHHSRMPTPQDIYIGSAPRTSLEEAELCLTPV